MKMKRRILSGFLSLALMISAMGPGILSVGAAATPVSEIASTGYSTITDGNYATVPSDAAFLGTDVALGESKNSTGKAGATVDIEFTSNPATTQNPIILRDALANDSGSKWAGGTTFEKGVGVHPINESTEGYTVIDISKQNANRFYAAVGITNTTKTGAGVKGVRFSVYGIPKGGTEYTLIADSGELFRGTAGEFCLDISGYKTLKLTVAAVNQFGSQAAAWANACVYCAHDIEHKAAKETSTIAPGCIEHWHCKVCDACFLDEELTNRVPKSEVTIPQQGYVLGTDIPIMASGNGSKSVATYVNTNYSSTDPSAPITLQTADGVKEYTAGLGMHPRSKTSRAYTDFDLLGYDVNTFRATVGLTNANNEIPVRFTVVELSKPGERHAIMATSPVLYKGDTYEFELSVQGVRYLRLTVETAGDAITSQASAFVNPIVYCSHDLYRVPEKAATSAAAGNIEHWQCDLCDRLFSDSDCTTELSPEDVIIPRIETQFTKVTGSAFTDITENAPVYLSDAPFISYVTPASGSSEPRAATVNTKWGGGNIQIGANKTKFTKGIGILPSNGSAQDGYAILDISGYDMDHFYAAVGITGSAATVGSPNYVNQYGVVCSVYGSTEVTESSDLSDYTLLSSGSIIQQEAGEFKVDVSGYKTLLLLTDTTTNYNYGCDMVWANACLYCGHSDLTHVPAKQKTDLTTGNVEYWCCETCGACFLDSAATQPADLLSVYIRGEGYTSGDGTFNKPSGMTMLTDMAYSSYVAPAGGQTTPREAKVNVNWAGNPIKLGESQTSFTNGLGVTLSAKAAARDAAILVDVSAVSANRFYSAVGITGSASTPGNANYTSNLGINCYVYGSAKVTDSYELSDYTLLAASGDLIHREYGEFNVDITGCKTLLLVADTIPGKDNFGCDTAWANAGFYMVCDHDLSFVAGTAATERSIATVDHYHCANCGLDFADEFGEEKLTTIYQFYTANTTGTYMEVPADRLWLSTDLTALESKFGGTPVVAMTDKTYDNTNIKIIDCTASKTGSNWSAFTGGTSFTKGLGVHPQKQTVAGYAIYDLTGLNVNRFYSAVGLTKAANTDYGVRFRIYTMANGSDTFVEVANSGEVKRGASGEFFVDITDCKQLKLSVETVSTHASLSSVFANACVFSVCEHELQFVAGTETDLRTIGVIDHYVCTKCGMKFADEEATQALTNTKKQFLLNETGTYMPAPGGAQYITRDMITATANYSNSRDSIVVDPTTTVKLLDAKATKGASTWSGGTQFTKGLSGAHPIGATTPGYMIIDISGCSGNRFYAAVGLTNNSKTTHAGMIFKVYGTKDGTNYTLLSQSEGIERGESGEFVVDITGYTGLKLTYEHDRVDTYASMDNMWANACIYCAHANLTHVEAVAPTDTTMGNMEYWYCDTCDCYFADADTTIAISKNFTKLPSAGYTPIADGKYRKAPGGAAYIGTDIPIGDSKNGGSKIASAIDACYNTSVTKIQLRDGTAAKDPDTGKWTGGTTFAKGLGVHPCSATAEGYTIVDISGCHETRFYAVVGITHEGVTGTGAQTDCGACFRVFGTKDGKSWILLGESGEIKRGVTGEFDLDVAGYRQLKLTISCTDKYESLAAAWADACLYCVHDLSYHPAVASTETVVGSIEYWSCDICGKYFKDAEGKSYIANKADVLLGGFTAVSDTYDSVPVDALLLGEDIQWTESKNGGKGFEAGLNYCYNSTDLIWLRDSKAVKGTGKWTGGTLFEKGLGVHPQGETKEGYTVFDLSGQNVNTFYAAVGMTNDAVSTDYGVNFKVWGKKEGDTAYTLLGQSGTVKRGVSGQFHLDITDYVTLKLSTEAVGGYASQASAWANACVYAVTPEEHFHTLVYVPATAPTKTSQGMMAYYRCASCGDCFFDEFGENPVEDMSALFIGKLPMASNLHLAGSDMVAYCDCDECMASGAPAVFAPISGADLTQGGHFYADDSFNGKLGNVILTGTEDAPITLVIHLNGKALTGSVQAGDYCNVIILDNTTKNAETGAFENEGSLRAASGNTVILNGNANADIQGGEISAVTVNDGGKITLSNNALVDSVFFANPNADTLLTIQKGYTGVPTLSWADGTCVLGTGMELPNVKLAAGYGTKSFTGILVANNGETFGTAAGNGKLKVIGGATGVSASGAETRLTAFGDMGAYDYAVLNFPAEIKLSGNAVIDVNDNDATVDNANGVVSLLNSSTDAYGASDAKIAVTNADNVARVTGNPASGAKYVVINNGDGTFSPYWITVKLTKASVRTTQQNVGVYYTSQIRMSDELKQVASNIGIAASLSVVPDENFISEAAENGISYTQIVPAITDDEQVDLTTTSGLIENILQKDRTSITQDAAGRTPIKVNAYAAVELEDGETYYIMSAKPATLSLFDLVQKINTQYQGSELPDLIKKMISDWDDPMADWGLGNLGQIKLTEGGVQCADIVNMLDTDTAATALAADLTEKTGVTFTVTTPGSASSKHKVYVGTFEQLSDYATIRQSFTNYQVRAYGGQIYVILGSESCADAAFAELVNACDEVDDGVYAVPTSLNVMDDLVQIGETVPAFTAGEQIYLDSVGSGNYEAAYTGVNATDLNTYKAALSNAGFTGVSSNAIADNLFCTYTKNDTQVHVNYFKNLEEIQIIYGPATYQPNTAPVADAGVVRPSVAMIAVTGDEECVVFQASDGSFVIFDGGEGSDAHIDKILNEGEANEYNLVYDRSAKEDMHALWSYLKENTPGGGKPQVTWVITHADIDHIGLPPRFINAYAGKFDLNTVIYNFPDYAKNLKDPNNIYDLNPARSQRYADLFISAVNTNYPKAKHMIYHTGDVFQMPGATMDILITTEDYVCNLKEGSALNMNHTSGIFRIKAAGKTILIAGDAERQLCIQSHTVYGSELKSDIFQVNHHGGVFYKNQLDFVKDVNPSVTLWCLLEIYMTKDNRRSATEGSTPMQYLRGTGNRLEIAIGEETQVLDVESLTIR